MRGDSAIKKKLALLMVLAMLLPFASMQFVFAADEGNVNLTQNVNSKETDTATKLENLIKSYGVTSVQYAVIDNGRISVSGQRGVYSKSDNRALTADNMYGIGSVSKMFVATAIMKLVEQGKVNLDSPVTTYIKEFKMADERYRYITVRMLLNHSSGIMGSSFNNAFLFDDNDTLAHDQLLARLKAQKLKADPGAFSVYCNDGFTLAELVVERVSGKSFTEFVNQYIMEPLGMENTKTTQASFDESQLSRVYYPGVENALPTDTVNVIGAGGIYSTAEDLCRFARIFMKEQGEAGRVLSQALAASMAGEEYKRGMWPEKSENFKYGLGWDNVHAQPFAGYSLKALNKGGDTYFYHGSLIVLPERNLAAAVLSSGGSSLYNQMIAESLLMEALGAEGIMVKSSKAYAIQVSDVQSPKAPVGMPADMLKYAGYYGDNQKVMKVDISEAGELLITIPSVKDYEETYKYSDDGFFTDKLGILKLGFVDEKNGKTYIHVSTKGIISGLGNKTVTTNLNKTIQICIEL